MLVELGSTIFTDNNIIQSIENLVEYWEEVINTDREYVIDLLLSFPKINRP